MIDTACASSAALLLFLLNQHNIPFSVCCATLTRLLLVPLSPTSAWNSQVPLPLFITLSFTSLKHFVVFSLQHFLIAFFCLFYVLNLYISSTLVCKLSLKNIYIFLNLWDVETLQLEGRTLVQLVYGLFNWLSSKTHWKPKTTWYGHNKSMTMAEDHRQTGLSRKQKHQHGQRETRTICTLGQGPQVWTIKGRQRDTGDAREYGNLISNESKTWPEEPYSYFLQWE